MPGPIFSLQYVHRALENALRDLVQKAEAVTHSASSAAAVELLEAHTFAALVLREFGARRVHVEVKKFIIPEARHVSVRIVRPR